MGENIKVCCRFRKEFEKDESSYDDWIFDKEMNQVLLKDRKFTYDFVMTPETDQFEMYEKVAQYTISEFLKGFNGTIFAYGQSGSGKTFSMLGPDDVVNALAKDFSSVAEEVQMLYGIIPRAINDIFLAINKFTSEGSQVTLSCSSVEIYNEKIRCLLSMKEDLKIREAPGQGILITEKEIQICKSPEDIFECIATSAKNRSVAETNQNDRSSRSHHVLILDFEYNGIDGVKKVSKLNLVDLAGSERISKTGVKGQNLKEAQKINQSLTTLGMCIMSLTTEGSKHVPYRNSKLTLVLKESLGGNSKTTLLCTCSRKKHHHDESIQTLYFAQRAKSIKNNCRSNVTVGVKELQMLIEIMRKEILNLRGQLKVKGLNFKGVTDEKLLQLIPNDLFEIEGQTEKSSPDVSLRGKRNSLINLTEEQVIWKYLDLRADYEALKANAGQRINELSSLSPENAVKEFSSMADGQFKDIIMKKDQESKQLIENYESKILALEENEKKLKENNKVLENEKNALINESDSAKQELEAMQSMQELTQSDIGGMQNQLEEKQKQIDSANETIKLNQIELTNKQESVNKLNESIQNNETKVFELNQQILDLNANFEKLKLEKNELQSSCDYKTDNENKLNARIAELQELLKTKDNKIADLEKNLNENKNDSFSKISSLEADLNNSKQNSQNLSQDNENLKKENQRLTGLINEKISAQDFMKENEKALNDIKQGLEDKINSLTEENKKLKEELANLNSQLQSVKNQSELDSSNMQRNHEAEKVELNNLLEQSKNELARLEEKNKSEVSKNQSLQGNVDEYLEKLKKLEGNSRDQGQELKNLKEQVESKNLLINENEIKLQGLKKQVEDLGTEKQNLKEEVRTNKEASDKERQDLIEKSSQETKSLKNEVAVLKSAAESHDKENNDNATKLTEVKAEVMILQDRYQKLQNSFAQLEYEKEKVKKTSLLHQKEGSAIKTKVNLKTNMFGVLLKKNPQANKIIKEAKEESKLTYLKNEEIMKDRLDQLAEIRGNIECFSPRTLSSRSISDIEDFDFMNEESYKKIEAKMYEKELAIEKVKQVETEKGMI